MSVAESLTRAHLQQPSGQQQLGTSAKVRSRLIRAALPMGQRVTVPFRVRLLMRLSAFGITGEVPIPRLDELLEVAGQNQLLGKAPYGAERCRELDPVNHRGSRPVLAELMDVPEPPKRALDLLIHKIVR